MSGSTDDVSRGNLRGEVDSVAQVLHVEKFKFESQLRCSHHAELGVRVLRQVLEGVVLGRSHYVSVLVASEFGLANRFHLASGVNSPAVKLVTQVKGSFRSKIKEEAG